MVVGSLWRHYYHLHIFAVSAASNLHFFVCVIFRIVLISSISCIDYSCIAKFKGISAAFQDSTDLKSELLLLLHNSSAKKSSNYVEFTFILSWMWFFFLVFTNIMKNHGIKTNAISWLPFMLCSIEIVWWTKEKVSSSTRETTLFFCFIFGKLKKKVLFQVQFLTHLRS